MQRHDVDGHVVLSHAKTLGFYMPQLAVAVLARFGWAPGERYVADLYAVMREDATIFPPDLGAMGRKMRLERLCDSPLQVDDLVITLEHEPRLRTYQKTKKFVVRRGTLGADVPAPRHVTTNAHPNAGAGTSEILRRLDATDRAVTEYKTWAGAQINELKDILDVYGCLPGSGDDTERAASFRALRQDVDILIKRVTELGALLPSASGNVGSAEVIPLRHLASQFNKLGVEVKTLERRIQCHDVNIAKINRRTRSVAGEFSDDAVLMDPTMRNVEMQATRVDPAEFDDDGDVAETGK